NTFSLLRGLLSVSVSLLYEDGMTQFNEVKRRLAPFSWAWNDPSSSLEGQVAIFDRTPFTSVQTVNSLRLNSLSVRFALPSQVARRLGAQAMSIQVQGTNLGLWTNYSGLDPNVTGRLAGSDVTDPSRPPRPRVGQVRVDASYGGRGRGMAMMSAQGRRWPWSMVLGTLLLAGCSLDSLLGTEKLPQDVSDPATIETPDGAGAAYRGALIDFQNGFHSVVYWGGVLTDELEL